jgi:predicted lipoprotein with Yx(FWY)xxD motif
MKKPVLLGAVAPLAAAVAIAGCGGGSGTSGSAYGAAPTAPTAPTAPAALRTPGAPTTTTVAVNPSKLGGFLTDAAGRTLYLFAADKTSASTCYSACASIWPPLTTKGAVKAGTGALASHLGATKRSDGTTEVTYGGHPLYYYAGDSKPGDITGQGLNQFGAKWYVVGPNGSKIDTDGH